MLRSILTHPDPRLRIPSDAISHQELRQEEIQTLIDDLIETMKKSDGIGIASPQVGVTKQIIVIDQKNAPLVLINPVITSYSKKETLMEEGCLSVPGIFGIVRRPEKIHFKALDRQGIKVRKKAKGFLSRVLQHEYDHLQGILFIDKIEKEIKAAHFKLL